MNKRFEKMEEIAAPKKERNPAYLESITAAISSMERSGESNERGVTREAIYKYCATMRSYTNKMQMLNQIRLALRRGVESGALFSEDGRRFQIAKSCENGSSVGICGNTKSEKNGNGNSNNSSAGEIAQR